MKMKKMPVLIVAWVEKIVASERPKRHQCGVQARTRAPIYIESPHLLFLTLNELNNFSRKKLRNKMITRNDYTYNISYIHI